MTACASRFVRGTAFVLCTILAGCSSQGSAGPPGVAGPTGPDGATGPQALADFPGPGVVCSERLQDGVQRTLLRNWLDHMRTE